MSVATEEMEKPTVLTVIGGVTEALPPTPDASLKMNVYHDKKNRPVEVRVEGIETLEGYWG